jgi:tryptophan synthase alpha chain
MDGPTIQAAADTALRGGVRAARRVRVVERVAAAGGRAVVMTYFNPVLRYGVDAFGATSRRREGSG